MSSWQLLRVVLCSTALCCIFSHAAHSQTDSLTFEADTVDVQDDTTLPFLTPITPGLPVRFADYYEANYAFGLSGSDHYLGFSYTHMISPLGFHLSSFYGLGTNSISLLAGPNYTFHVNQSGSSLQAFWGMGINYQSQVLFASHMGLRYCFNKGALAHTETLSASVGLLHVDHQWCPTLGISVVPMALKAAEMWDDKEYDYPHHYSEFLVGYGVDQLLIGANYTYIPSKIGAYVSAVVGINMDYGINVGPTVRLTDGSWGIDLQAFQGMGVFSGNIAGETGLRIGFGDDMKYGKWSLSAAMGYSQHGIYGTLGMSWPITAYVGIATGVVMYGVALAMGGGDITDAASLFPTSWNESSGGYSPPAESTRVSASGGSSAGKSGGADCSTYQMHYDKMVQNMQNAIQTYTRTGSGYIQQSDPYTVHVKMCAGGVSDHCVGQTSISGAQSSVRRIKKDMEDLRRRAQQAGCSIQRSPWEGGRITTY